MLHEVARTHRIGSSGGFEFSNGVELMVPGEDDAFLRDSLPVDLGFLDFEVNESAEDVHEAVPLPDLLPQIPGSVSTGVIWISRSVVVPPVERQERGALPVEPRRHEHEVGIDGEMDERPFLELEEGMPGISSAVLGDRVLNGLVRKGVLQFGRGYRDAVHEQHEVD